MPGKYWMLVVEPRDADRRVIESAAQAVAPDLDVVFVATYDAFIPALASRGKLPTLAVLDWYAPGVGAPSCIDTLERLGFASRMPMVATSREKALEALDESYELGVHRFVSKLPDDNIFTKKIAEAIAEFVPGARKTGPPSAVLQA